MRKKLIEVALPLDAINKESAREKLIRHGHPSTLHLWWAILRALNKPDDFILAIVQVDGEIAERPVYVRKPVTREPDFGVTSVNYGINELLVKGIPAM